MNYNDFSILTDSEYAKIAQEYASYSKTDIQIIPNTNIQKCFDLMNECKNFLLFKNVNNYSLLKELNNHELTLNKIIDNFKINFNVKNFLSNKIFDFNLFTYLKMLFELKNYLNNYLNFEEKNKTIIKNTIFEIDNLFNSIFENLSKLNIKIFKFM